LPRPLTSLERAVVSSSNRFAFDLLEALNTGQEDENLFVSPLSVSMALGMTMNGAASTTFDQMRATLGFDGLSREQVNAAYRDLLDLFLGLDRNVEATIGNSVWYREGFPVHPEFLDDVTSAFAAHVEAVDFADPATVDLINAWVRNATRSRIDGIVERIDPLDRMFLVNAIYFNGRWREPFDPAMTGHDTFRGSDGPVPVEMMRRIGSFRFLQRADLSAVDLPYGNGAFSMTILLPAEDGDVNELLRALDAETWSQIVSGFGMGTLAVSIPRFRLEYDESLVRPLRSMGMVAPFSGEADFSRMSPEEGLRISEVRHRTFVQVDEAGTEAAAATGVTVGVVSAPPSFRVDRPFLVAIRERFSGTLLFLGKVMAPAAIPG